MDYLKTGEINLRDIHDPRARRSRSDARHGLPARREDIIARCPRERQTLFFSATVPPEIAAVASFALRNPARVEVGVARSVTASVNHALYPVAAEQKFELLEALLAKTDFDSVLVFPAPSTVPTNRAPAEIREPLRRRPARESLAEPAHRGARRLQVGKYEVMVRN